MSLQLRRGSRFFYTEVQVAGRRRVVSTGVTVRGQRPASLREQGDSAFEASRAEALVAQDKIRRELKEPASAATRLRRLHELQLGITVRRVEVQELADQWLAIDRDRPLVPRYRQVGIAIIARFVGFMHERYPAVQDVCMVNAQMAESFMREQSRRGLSNKTYNEYRSVLQTAFESTQLESGLVVNPFSQVRRKNTRRSTVHRKAFTADQARHILHLACETPTIGDVVTTALCTGLRRSDAAQLRWSSVHLDDGYIALKASKTGEPVRLPILPPLESALRRAVGADEHFCWPAAAAMVQSNPDGLTYRFIRLLAQAGIRYADEDYDHQNPRLRRPSTRGIHSLKTTFVTLCLLGGVKIEVLRLLVGNRCLDTLLKYFQPDDETIAAELRASLPFRGSARPRDAEHAISVVLRQLERMNAENWSALRNEAVDALKSIITARSAAA
jgi:integrase